MPRGKKNQDVRQGVKAHILNELRLNVQKLDLSLKDLEPDDIADKYPIMNYYAQAITGTIYELERISER